MPLQKNLGSIEIDFLKLQESHFPLLLKWLEAPHIKKWWDQDISYTQELVKEKYSSYVLGYKADDNLKKVLGAYIINLNRVPIGYIQVYDFYDFPREYELKTENLPASLAGIDLFIGEAEFIHKGYGAAILEQFINNYVFKEFNNCFVDPDNNNIAAIRAYEKAGFKKIKSYDTNVTWMIREKIV